MLKKLPTTLLGLILSCAVSAQCDLTVATTDFICDPASGGYTFNLLVTGSDSTVRFPALDLELPLPVDEIFFVPIFSDEIILELESGAAPDICSTSVTLTPPEGCEPGSNNCFVHIEAADLECGIPGQLNAVATGTPPFSYSWNTGDTTSMIPFGETFFDYAVTVTDAEGCSAQTSHFFGAAHPFYIHLESTGNPCIEGQEANISASTFGGQAPYSYVWSTGDTSATLTDVIPEVLYTVTVTDAAGCTGTAQGLYHPGAFTEHLNIEGPNTTNCDGSPITLSVINPDPDFEYIWTSGTDTLFGASITTTTGGAFSITGFNPENPDCQSLGNINVTEVNLASDHLAIINFGHPCEEGGCVVIADTRNGFFILDQVEITWTSPTATIADPGLGFICLDEAAVYEATIASSCDTVSLSFEIEADPVCTEVCGSVILDMDQDCIPDEESHDWTQTSVILTNTATNLSYPIHLNPDGTFCAELPKGGYTITTVGNGMTLSTECDQVRNTMEIQADNGAAMDLFASNAIASESGNETTNTNSDLTRPEILLTVYPNPSNGSIWFDFSDQRIAPTDVLTLYDGLGRRVTQNTVAALPQPWLPAQGISGVYQVVLTDQRGALKARTKVVFQ